LKAHFELSEKLEAPIAEGTEVGTLSLKLDEDTIATYPLVALEEVQQGGLFDRAMDWISLKIGLEE
jgi:D-alanyl-D-alanine carboxypeptidase (penicillin-binding protein 5/6)